MPIYEFECEGCKSSVEIVRAIGVECPDCSECGGVMIRKFSPIALLKLKNGSYTHQSKGYKDGYQREYLKSKGQELWRDTIVSS